MAGLHGDGCMAIAAHLRGVFTESSRGRSGRYLGVAGSYGSCGGEHRVSADEGAHCARMKGRNCAGVWHRGLPGG